MSNEYASSFPAPLAARCYSHGKVETDEEFDARWVTYFSKPDIDAWELRKGDFDAPCPCPTVHNYIIVMLLDWVHFKS